MAKYICHASIDERGKSSGGQAGDQTKKEVCIREMYYKPWNQFFHIANDAVRVQFGNNMIDIANNECIGYDQNQRNTLLTQAKKVNFDFSKISTKCETDCSAVITVALLGAIYKVLGNTAYQRALAIMVVSGNCATTTTFRTRVAKLTDVKVLCYTSAAYTNSTSKAVFGDIYNKSGSHIVCYIDNGKKVSTVVTKPTVATTDKLKINSNIKAIQKWLNTYYNTKISEDGLYGKNTKKALIKAWQKEVGGLEVDGDFGKKSKEAAKKVVLKKGNKGILVTILQATLVCQKYSLPSGIDGDFGSETAKAVLAVQNKHKLADKDSIVGKDTWCALFV